MTPEERQAMLAQYHKEAEVGSAAARYRLGVLYQTGDGVKMDLTRAFHWFSLAALQNHPASLFELGAMFRYGLGVERDLLVATRCHVLAALLGEIAAQGHLCDGLEQLQDLALAGDRAACRFLCDMYGHGLGVDRNPALVWTWVRWAHERCVAPFDPDDVEWVEGAVEQFRSVLAEQDREDGDRVFESLVGATRAMRAVREPGSSRRGRGIAGRREGRTGGTTRL